jgi:aminocarboxymuconate-semialdehyde decarboxylase
MIVDIHSHLFPPAYMASVERAGGRLPQLSAAPLSSLTLDERFELMSSQRIDLGVLSVGALQPYHADRGIAVGLAHEANDVFLETSSESAGRLLTFAVLPLPHLDAALEELDRVAGEKAFAGVTLGTSVLSHELDDEILAPVYEELDARGTTVFVHPAMMFPGFGPRDLGMTRTIGGMFEDTIAGIRLLLSGVCVRYPRINFVVPHLGGTLPFIYGRIGRHLQRCEREWQAAGLATADDPHTGLGRLWFDTAVRHEPALTCAHATLGPHRLVFGTDYPYLKTRAELAVRLANVRDLEVSTTERAAILGASAAGLVGLEVTNTKGRATS